MTEWRSEPYLRSGMRNDAFLEHRNAMPDHQKGGGIRKSTIAAFKTKLYVEAEFCVQDYTRKRMVHGLTKYNS